MSPRHIFGSCGIIIFQKSPDILQVSPAERQMLRVFVYEIRGGCRQPQAFHVLKEYGVSSGYKEARLKNIWAHGAVASAVRAA